MACFLPFRPLDLKRALGFSISRVAADELTKATILSCTSTPPRRVYLTRAADLLPSYVDRKPPSTRTSRKLFCPSAFPESWDPFFHRPFRIGVPRAFALLPGCRVEGFGYPLNAYENPNFLGGLFQPPTLLGFAFQSFVSSRVIGAVYPPSFPLLRFPTKPLGLIPALQRLAPTSGSRPPWCCSED
jgi:hypothetical protein